MEEKEEEEDLLLLLFLPGAYILSELACVDYLILNTSEQFFVR